MFFKQEAVSLARFIERLVFDKFCVINLSVLLIPIIHFDNLFFKEYHNMACNIFYKKSLPNFHIMLDVKESMYYNNFPLGKEILVARKQ